jgi:uncharacterized membrane protein
MLQFFKKKTPAFFTEEEQQKVVSAIQFAEQQTSGEVRVYVESKCRFVDPLDRAAELFYGLKMNETTERNGVLVYIAMKHRQLAVFADEGIYEKAGSEFWKKEVRIMLADFNKENYAEGIAKVVNEIGEVLSRHFPYDAAIDKNELPDDIVFGK